jgi:Ca2+-binding EF-hand superfamily protein
MVNIDPPSLKEIDAFASQLFEKVDSDGSGAVSFNEFQRWMKHSF